MVKSVRILFISDGKTGHDNASYGIINCIKNIYSDVMIDRVQVKIKSKIFLKILKFCFNYKIILDFFINNPNIVNFFYYIKDKKQNKFKYDYIISAGGDTSFINIIYSKKYNIKNIYVSRLRGLDNKFFYLILTIYEEDNFENSILLDFPPIEKKVLDNEKLKKFKKEINYSSKEKIFSLLIGGDGSGYIYKEVDFIKLIENFLIFLKKNNSYGLITTSRRTGLDNELLIEKVLNRHKFKNRIKYSIFFNKKEEYLLDCYFNIAEVLFVTEESGAMLTESILSNKPVYTLKPKKIKFNKLYSLFLKGKNKFITKNVDIKELNNLELDFLKINNIPSPSKYLERKLFEFINSDN